MTKKTYKIGVFGSASGKWQYASKQAENIGKLLAKENCVMITGACSGLPYIAALAASKLKGQIWGFSAAYNLKGQKSFSKTDENAIYNKLIYVPKKFPFTNIDSRRKYRNVISTATSDAGIVIAGRWGTLHEVASLHDFGKVIGVLTETGGVSDELKNLNKKLYKPTGAKFIFSNNAKRLVGLVIMELKKRKK